MDQVKKKIFIKYEKRKTNDFHYVGYMYLLDDVDVCLSIYSIIIELIDSIEREKKRGDECDIPSYRYTMTICIYI